MTATVINRIICPRCNRSVVIKNSRYEVHANTAGTSRSGRCRLSEQLVPQTTDTDEAYERRARLIADLAEQVQDADPALVWDYLTALPAAELQRLTMIALAGIPVDRRIDDIFAWVVHLPVARLEIPA